MSEKRKGGNFYGENKEHVSHLSQRAENHFYPGSLCNACCLALILNSVASINIGPYVKIGFSGIPNQIADYLFGPITGCLFAGVLDIVKFFIRLMVHFSLGSPLTQCSRHLFMDVFTTNISSLSVAC